jgi:uncharacterized protein (TIGR02145 family)
LKKKAMKRLLITLFLLSLLPEAFSQFTCGSLLTDTRDGKQYQTVQIGTQCWMAENLNYGSYTAITVPSDYPTNNGTVEKQCYNNDTSMCSTYGALYQWNEMMDYSNVEGSQGICPDGWHVPTDAEYSLLASNYPSDAGTALQSGGVSGFDALLTGYGY